MGEKREDMAYTMCSAIAYHYDNLSVDDVVKLYGRYESFDMLVTIAHIMEAHECTQLQAEERLSTVIERVTSECFTVRDGKIDTKVRNSNNMCRVFSGGIPWLEFIKPEPHASGKKNGHKKTTGDGFLND